MIKHGERLAAFGLWVALFAPAPARADSMPAPIPTTLHVLYLARAGDQAYGPGLTDSGLARPALPEPSPGADLAIRDTRATALAAGLALALDKRILGEDEPIAPAIPTIATSGAVAVIADVPMRDLEALGKGLGSALAIFNIRHAEDRLRRDLCGTGVFHVIPSATMQTDALAQFVAAKTWRRVLILRGPLPEDLAFAGAFIASAHKFGLRVIDTRQFVYGNDPRKREQNDIGLMSGWDDYDVVFLSDTAGDLGRYVPFELARPRPVIGTEGLSASAWDPSAERYGAPQVNHRFARLAHRGMTVGDWAAWVAVRAVVEAAVRKGARTPGAVEQALARDDLPIDVSKGTQSSFRAWDHQLRQAIMLHTSDAVIAYAPIEGFLHQRTPLDTLGADQGENNCR